MNEEEPVVIARWTGLGDIRLIADMPAYVILSVVIFTVIALAGWSTLRILGSFTAGVAAVKPSAQYGKASGAVDHSR